MAMNIKDPEAERLAAEVAELTGNTKTGAVREALRHERDRLTAAAGTGERRRSLRDFLEQEIWPLVSPEVRGTTMTKAEREEILGYGPYGA
jgi:antitoxin VapB